MRSSQSAGRVIATAVLIALTTRADRIGSRPGRYRRGLASRVSAIWIRGRLSVLRPSWRAARRQAYRLGG
jgi:hypothetical protein